MPKRILVVDDEPDVIKIVQLSLENAGYQVSTAENGNEALERVTSDNPDLILLDQIMPEMNGLEVIRELKGNESTKKIPIVLLTARDSPSDMMEGWETGTDLYLLKPVMMTDLVGFINCILA